MTAHYDYRLFGLRIRSRLELSSLRPHAPGTDAPEASIALGAVPEALPNPSVTTPFYDIQPGELLIRIPGVARYLVSGGREIVIEPAEGVDQQSLELFLLGSAFGGLLQQCGFLPLHASAVDIGGACVAFTGHSGAGKSTMAAVLAKRGYAVVCDDVCVIRGYEAGRVLVSAAESRVKLWADGLTSMHIGVDGLRAVRVDTAKYHVPVSGVDSERTIPLAAVYVLSELGERRSIEALHGFEAVLAIAENTYRREFIEPLGLLRTHFAHCGEVARGVRIRRLTRPRDFNGIERTLVEVEADWLDLGIARG